DRARGASARAPAASHGGPQRRGLRCMSFVSYERASVRTASGRAILDRLTLEVAEGETLALIGRSGSGKTTALPLLNQRPPPPGDTRRRLSRGPAPRAHAHSAASAIPSLSAPPPAAPRGGWAGTARAATRGARGCPPWSPPGPTRPATTTHLDELWAQLQALP